MKGSIFAAAALRRDASASVWSSAAPAIPEETCGCTTKVITYYGSATLVPVGVDATSVPTTSTPVPESTSTLTSTVHSTSTSTLTVTVSASSSVAPVASSTAVATTSTSTVELPTADVLTFSTTGVYTIPATTITVYDTTTVCGATSTEVPSGTVTYGGVTTVVSTATTVTCPYATVKTSGTTVTSVIETTTYVCPSAGTYTVVAPTTTSVPTSTVLVYPTPQTITPGTYTQDETTVTVTRTDYTYICPVATESLASTTAAAVTTTAVSVPTTEAVTTTAAATTSTAAPVVSSASSASSSSSSSTTSSSSSTSTATIPTELGEGQYGMTYSPYTSAGDCKTKAAVLADLTVIQGKGFNLIRVYSTDCSGLEYIGAACKELGLTMILGVYIDSTGTSAAQEQVDEIAAWAEWSLVDLLVVGNEAVSAGYVDAATLASFITSSAATFAAAGYTGLVTTTEPIDIWQSYGESALCDVVDLVGANIHPFFNADTTAAEAGTFAKAEFELLEEICGKNVLNLETGWPNAGDANGDAVPGVAQQKTAIEALVKIAGSKSIFFSYADDTWKSPGEFDVEQHWGCASVF
ncbi:unnamed protein product [Penicillium glandicola]